MCGTPEQPHDDDDEEQDPERPMQVDECRADGARSDPVEGPSQPEHDDEEDYGHPVETTQDRGQGTNMCKSR